MTKAMFTLYRRPDMNGDQFREYWKNTHAQKAAKMPGLRKYVQNHALATEEGEPPVAGIAEVYFDSVEAMQEALSSPEGEAAIADLENFTDAEKTATVIVDEVEVV
ncbi:MAG: hypothetical protein AVDCRST_MAG80-131 [uncultured Rubrobacteraceae bacterium]|uniref:EthD domain-containing protein n=1 Tax=uncultured Rubrobacteraceae bacterium TaxID=349277 RepID=A0A6J4PSI2_9ACTN|nr:MAG: hypothetical protein AVDCRST_MAG80-131 [uncultured Rubrobacteraceae bacterium]